MAKFKFHVSTGYVGSSREEIVEIEDDLLEGLDEESRNNFLNECWEEWLWNGNITGGWDEVVDDA